MEYADLISVGDQRIAVLMFANLLPYRRGFKLEFGVTGVASGLGGSGLRGSGLRAYFITHMHARQGCQSCGLIRVG